MELHTHICLRLMTRPPIRWLGRVHSASGSSFASQLALRELRLLYEKLVAECFMPKKAEETTLECFNRKEHNKQAFFLS